MNRRRLFSMLVAAVTALAAWPVARFVTWRQPAVRDVHFSPEELHAAGVLYKDEVFLLPLLTHLPISPEDEPRVALSARCSHLGCLVSFDAVRREFHCPCHQSVYDAQGRRLAGPTERGLERLPVALQDNGGLIVKAPV